MQRYMSEFKLSCVIISLQLNPRYAASFPGPARTTSVPPRSELTAPSRSVSPTDHGVLRGPICDSDRRLWSFLPRPDHTGGDLRRAMEVIALLRANAATALGLTPPHVDQ